LIQKLELLSTTTTTKSSQRPGSLQPGARGHQDLLPVLLRVPGAGALAALPSELDMLEAYYF